jgi:hypothetical protein
MSAHITTSATVVTEQGSLDYARIGYENLARTGTASASTSNTNFPADAPQRSNSYEQWQPTAIPAYWQVDLGSSGAVNYIGIGAHNLGTNLCQVYAQYSGDAVSWTDASDVAIPSDDSAMLLLFPSQTARYWRLVVDGIGSPTGSIVDYPKIGSIYIGTVLTMPRSLYGGQSPLKLGRETTLNMTLSRGGQFLNQTYRRRGYVATIGPWRFLDPTWYRTYFDPFVKAARLNPFFISWRPGDWPDEVLYAWSGGDIAPQNMGVRDFMTVNISVRGLDDE